MDENLNDILIDVKENNNDELRSKFIQEYFPFIIKTVSNFTGKYVKVNSSEEFSVALEAFDEAIDRYEFERGRFVDFAKLVIGSRLKDYFKKVDRQKKISKDNLIQLVTLTDFEKEYMMKKEIEAFKNELNEYGITIDKLLDNVPVHKKTKENAVNIAQVIVKHSVIISKLKKTKHLPRIEIKQKIDVTDKQLKRSRYFIIAVMIVLSGEYEEIRQYLSIEEFGGK